MLKVSPRAAAPLAAAILIYAVMYSAWPVAHLFLPDDAFYYFEIARHIAAGEGSTFDGINPTNGYHPLWCGLLAVIGLLPLSKDAFVAAALLVQCGLLAWAVIALYRVCVRGEGRPSMAAVAVSAVWLGNFYVSKTVVNGMESALLAAASVLLIGVAADRLAREETLAAKDGALLGGLGAVVLMSRLDSFFLLGAIAVVWGVARRARLRTGWAAALAFVGVPAVVLAAYMGANQAAFGLPMPVSGYLKRFTGGPPRNVTTMALLAPFAGVVALAYRGVVGRWAALESKKHIAYSILTLFVLLMQADSMLLRAEAVPAIWYLSQHSLWVLATLWLLVEREGARRWVTGGVVGAAALFAAATWVIRLQRSSYDIYLQRREMAGWMNRELPAGSIVGSWDAGITGYYCDHPVVNLDGLVNSYEYAQSMMAGRGIDYLDRVRVTHLAQVFLVDFDHFQPAGYDSAELHRRAASVIWSIESEMKPVGAIIRPYLRTGKKFPMQVRVYSSASPSP